MSQWNLAANPRSSSSTTPISITRCPVQSWATFIRRDRSARTGHVSLCSDNQRKIVQGYIEKGKAEGARLITGGNTPDRDGFFIEPTVFADVTDDMTIAREEIFGPVMCVLDFETEEEALRRANDTEFGLAASVFTNDLTRAHRMSAGFEAGTCYINTHNLAPVEAPFGGSKLSGVGRENSKLAINHYSEMKTVYVAMNDVEAPF